MNQVFTHPWFSETYISDFYSADSVEIRGHQRWFIKFQRRKHPLVYHVESVCAVCKPWGELSGGSGKNLMHIFLVQCSRVSALREKTLNLISWQSVRQLSACLNQSVQSRAAKNKTGNIKSYFHEIQPQLLSTAVTLSCRWNQSLVSVKLQGRGTNNTSHSDVWRYYTADNKISQQPFFSRNCTKLFLKHILLTMTPSIHTSSSMKPFIHVWWYSGNVGAEGRSPAAGFISTEGGKWEELI